MKEAHEELKKDHKTACKKLQDCDAQLLKSMGTIREMNTAMERKQMELTELEDAAFIVADMVDDPLPPGVEPRSLLERLRDAPQKLMGCVFKPEVVVPVAVYVLGLVKSFYPDTELEPLAVGIAEDCKEERFDEYMQMMEIAKPIAELLSDE